MSAYGLVYTFVVPYLSVIYIPFPHPFIARTTTFSIRTAAFIVIVYVASPVSVLVEEAVVKVAFCKNYLSIDTANSGLLP